MSGRKTAQDYDPELLALFQAYVHGDVDRRGFLARAARFAAGGATAAMLLAELAPDFAAAQVVTPDDARIVAARVTFASPRGSGKMAGYLVRPADGSARRAGVLVIHENRGLNPHIEDVARRFALAGYVAFAPDALFPLGGYPGEEDAARELFRKLDERGAREDFLAALGWLRSRPECTGRAGAVGFCWGGGMVGWLATATTDLAAGVAFYGNPPDPGDVVRIRAPMLIQSAEIDERINARWPEFEAALRAANVCYERHLHPGTQHGFHNDTTPRYDEAAARLAWKQTVDFLDANVRG